MHRLTGTRFRVAFCGFAPGFPYLTGLPAELALPRLATPRPRVPAGSVALAGPYAGIYPGASPGGWLLVGRTDLVLFDVAADPPARLGPGTRCGWWRRDPPRPLIEVLRAGALTTVQDLGRPGWAHLGVPRSGALDPAALRLANRLVGNPEHAAGLEITLTGCTLRLTRAATVRGHRRRGAGPGGWPAR